MKKKLFNRLFIFSFAGILLAACGAEEANPTEETPAAETEDVETPATADTAGETEAEETVITVDIVVDGETIADLSKEIEAPEGMYLQDIMEANYNIETTPEGFMTVIEGYEQDTENGVYWMYYVNNEMPSVGAADYLPEAADQIEWRLEGFED